MEVQIRRREEISHLPTKVINEAKVFLGSHFDGRIPLSGLSKKEEHKYLPPIVGVDPNHPEFTQRVKDFWATMGFLVPSGGVVLTAGIDKETEEPYNLEDWIKFKWCQKHRLVANSQKEMEQDPRKKFYIFNPLEDAQRKHSEIQLRKQADVEFMKASKDIEKGKRIIRMMDSLLNPDSLTEIQIENKLYDLKNESPEKFLRIASDKKLDVKASLQEMLDVGILRKVGNQIIYIDQVVGETMDDAVAWYTNTRNSAVVTDLKAKLNELKVG